LTRSVRLVCIPSSDFYFGAYASEVLSVVLANPDVLDPLAEFQRLLRERYEAATVRAQDPLAAFGPRTETVWYATNRPFPSRISAVVEIAAPPELVYRVYVDRFPEWQPAARLERIDAGAGPAGSEYVARYRIAGRTLEGRFTVVAADPPRSVRVEAKGVGGIRVWYAASFVATASGTVVHVEGDYDLPAKLLPNVAHAVLQAAIRREIDRAHARLVELSLQERRAAADDAAD
jgi:uncharacterized protein YndB with AHSA1/START domain